MRSKGTILIPVLLISMVVIGLFLSLSDRVLIETKSQRAAASSLQALHVAESGAELVLEEALLNRDLDGKGYLLSSGNLQGTRFAARATSSNDGIWTARGAAERQGTRRGVEIIARKIPAGLPIPGLGADAALTLLGPLGRKAKVKIHVRWPHARRSRSDDDDDADDSDDDDESSWTSTSRSPVAIDGHDAARDEFGRPLSSSIPGFGIEDPITYARTADRIAHEMSHGKIPRDAILGEPMTTLRSRNHGGIQERASLVQLPSPNLSAERLKSLADTFADALEHELSVRPCQRITTEHLTGTTTWGASPNSVTVIDAARVILQPNAVVRGQGTLVVRGDLRMLRGSTLDFKGRIFVLGSQRHDAQLRNQHGTLRVDGGLFVLGGQARHRRARVELHSSDGRDPGRTEVRGPVLVLSGTDTASDKASFHVEHGHLKIDGFLSVVGDKTKLDLKPHRQGSVYIHGGVAVAVPNDNSPNKAKIHLHGEELLIQYHSANVRAALKNLEALENELQRKPWETKMQTLVWREIPPPTNLLSN